MRKNASEIIYDEVSLLGKPALFTDWRVDRATVPPELSPYELRHADEDWSEPCQLARGILVNLYGSVLTLRPIQLPSHGYLDFESESFTYVEEDACATISEFLKKYCEEV